MYVLLLLPPHLKNLTRSGEEKNGERTSQDERVTIGGSR